MKLHSQHQAPLGRRLPGKGAIAGKFQAGYTLVELLIAVVISLIAVSGMILIMSNTLGSTAQVIESTRLSNELRNSMSVLVRDIRRANFNESFIQCIGSGDSACTFVPDTMTVVTTTGSECISYGYERNGVSVNGAIRLSNNTVQLNTTNRNCTDSNAANWGDLTDNSVVQVTGLAVTEADGDNLLTYTAAVTPTLSQRIRKYRVTMTGRICRAGELNGCNNWVTRQVQSTVRVRNDILFATPVAP